MFGKEIKDSKSIYTGKDFEKLGIKNGMPYPDPIVKIAEELSSQLCHKFDFSCLFVGCQDCDCNTPEGYKNAIECLKKALCNINADQICISEKYLNGIQNGISSQATQLLNKSIYYKFDTPKGGEGVLSYDLSELIGSLDDCTLGRVNVVARGTKNKTRSIIRQTESRATSIIIPSDRFPVYVDFTIDLTLKEGDAQLLGTIALGSCTQHDGYLDLDVKDYTEKKLDEDCSIKLSTVLSNITGKQARLFSFQESLKRYKLQGTKYVNSAVGIFAAIGSLGAAVKSLCKRIDELETDLEECKNRAPSEKCP